ncbi:MAG: DegV family protein [Chloroflexi bacterium]|nr:DegV family protein [Chloroflexota bacterium]
MNPVMILTDSSAYLPADLIANLPIRVLPLTVNWDGETYRDGIDIGAEEFYTRLSKSSTLPTTSQIPAGEIDAELKRLLDEGYDVLVMLISSGISSTYSSAASAVENHPPERVALIDTLLVSMALGFQVLAAARLAKASGSLAACKARAEQAYQEIGVYFTVDTLKYLAAGGRIGTARRLLGSALMVKPMLVIRDGKIELVESVVSRRKAIRRLVELVEEGIGGRSPVRISVFHALARETADELMEECRQRFNPIEIVLSEVSPVIGSHVGPGTLAIAYQVEAQT